MSPANRVTIADLAKRLGLDKSSVSLALRGSKKISQATRTKVLTAAQQYGYRPNLAARQLASPGMHIISLVLPPSFAPLVHGVVVTAVQSLAREAAQAGVLFGVFSSDDLVCAFADGTGLGMTADGLLIWGDIGAQAMAQVAAIGRPYVILDPSDPAFATHHGPMVRLDNAGGAASLVKHLIEQGTQQLLFIQQQRHHLGHQERWNGARRQWIVSRPLDRLSFCMIDELSDEALRSFASRPGAGGAILCSNDMCAMEVWHRLQRLGVSVPQQVLLAGFDGETFGNLVGLTTAVFNGEGIGKAAFGVMARLLSGKREKAEPVVVPVSVRIGATTQRLK